MVELSRRKFFMGTAAAVATAALPIHVVETVEKHFMVVPPDLYAELMAITHKAFVPRLYVQLYRETPLLTAIKNGWFDDEHHP